LDENAILIIGSVRFDPLAFAFFVHVGVILGGIGEILVEHVTATGEVYKLTVAEFGV
jgi:hypothetical protein